MNRTKKNGQFIELLRSNSTFERNFILTEKMYDHQARIQGGVNGKYPSPKTISLVPKTL